jgi:hypothetical protein
MRQHADIRSVCPLPDGRGSTRACGARHKTVISGGFANIEVRFNEDLPDTPRRRQPSSRTTK